MALITRCPHCAATFRVTPLHLQAHRGDVRCGRCSEVFNAFSTLSTIKEPETGSLDQGKAEQTREELSTYQSKDELPAPAVSEQQLPPTSPHEITQAEARAESSGESVTGEAAAPGAGIQERTPRKSAEAPEARVGSPDASLQEPPASEPVRPVSEPTAERVAPDRDMAAKPSATISATDATSAPEKSSAAEMRETESLNPLNPPKSPESKAHQRKTQSSRIPPEGAETAKAHAEQSRAKGPTPKSAPSKAPPQEEGRERREGAKGGHERKNWETQEQKPEKTAEPEILAASYAFDTAVPNISPTWTVASLLLLIILTGQTIYFYRSELAVLVPPAKPYLEQYCELLQCSISLPRHPQSLNIESSDMHTDPQHPGVITLRATVRNHTSYPQAFPLLELTFIDNQNRPLASRIFKPDVYLGGDAGLAANVSPGNEFDVRLHLDTGDLNAEGYRLSLLYPNS